MFPSLAIAGGVIWSDRFTTTKAIRIAGFDGTGTRNLYAATVVDPRGVVVDAAGGRVFYLDRLSGGSSGALNSVSMDLNRELLAVAEELARLTAEWENAARGLVETNAGAGDETPAEI